MFKGICHPDYARMFVHIVLSKSYKRIEQYIPLNSLILRKQIHAKKTEVIKKTLIEHGVIECDNVFYPKLKSYGYRMGKKFQSVILSTEIKNKALLQKVRMAHPVIEKSIHEKIWFWLNQVEIDYPQAKKLLKNTNNVCQKSMMLEKLRRKDFFFSEDERGRVYHNVACLWSKFRKFLSINGIMLVNVDIKNSQPLLFTKILKDVLSSVAIYPISVAPLCDKVRKIEKSISPHLCTIYPSSVAPKDIVSFIQLVEEGKFYDFIMGNLGKMERGNFKRRFFAEVFYSKLDVETKLNRIFKTLFPTVSKVIAFCKKDDHRDLPLAMQKIEADLMIGQVCPRLNIPFLPVHDSILTLPQHADYVRKVITSVFNDAGLNPSFGM